MIKCPICNAELEKFTTEQEIVSVESLDIRIYPCSKCGYINKFADLTLLEYLKTQLILQNESSHTEK